MCECDLKLVRSIWGVLSFLFDTRVRKIRHEISIRLSLLQNPQVSISLCFITGCQDGIFGLGSD